MARIPLNAILCIALASCSTVSTPGVSNRGYIPVSTANPYAAANVFLGKEMSQGVLVKNFIKTRGAPTAISVKEGLTGETELTLLYLTEKESYIGERYPTSETTFDWSIRGPYGMNRSEYAKVAALYDPQARVAPIMVTDSLVNVPLRPLARDAFKKTIEPVIPPPLEETEKKAEVKPTPVIQDDELKMVPPARFKVWNTDQRAIYLARGYADRLENGDVRHEVTGGGDSMRRIAKWYTGSEQHLKELALINSAKPDQLLATGTVVIVPYRMLTRALKIPVDF